MSQTKTQSESRIAPRMCVACGKRWEAATRETYEIHRAACEGRSA